MTVLPPSLLTAVHCVLLVDVQESPKFTVLPLKTASSPITSEVKVGTIYSLPPSTKLQNVSQCQIQLTDCAPIRIAVCVPLELAVAKSTKLYFPLPCVGIKIIEIVFKDETDVTNPINTRVSEVAENGRGADAKEEHETGQPLTKSSPAVSFR